MTKFSHALTCSWGWAKSEGQSKDGFAGLPRLRVYIIILASLAAKLRLVTDIKDTSKTQVQTHMVYHMPWVTRASLLVAKLDVARSY